MEGVRRFFANMKLSVRLGLGFGLVLALLAVVGLFGLYTQGRLSDLNRKLYEHPFAVKSAVLTLETDIRNIQRSMNALLDATNASARNAALGQVELYQRDARQALQTIEDRFLGPRVMYLKAKGVFESWRQTCAQAHQMALAGRLADAKAIDQYESRQQAQLAVRALRDLRDFADGMAASIWAETQAARRQALVLMWVFMGAAVLLGVGFAVFITRSVSGPARQIALDAKALANGDLKHLIAYQSQDEIGQTAHSLRRMLSGVIGEGQSIKHGLRVPMWTADRDQTITYLNPAAARIAEAVTGLPEDKIVGRLKVSQALPDQDGLMSQMAGKSLEMDGQGTAEVSFTVEGQEMILLESTSPLTDLEGHLMGVMGVGVDITERKQAGQKLLESEERLRTLMEESFDGIFLQRGGTIVFTNQRLRQMLGYAEGELEGKEHWVVYHPDYQELTRRRALARMRGEKVVSDYEVKLLRKDGASFAAEVRAKPITVMGEPGIQVWLRDITERKEAERVRQEREAELAAIYENAPLIMLLVDQERRVLRINGFGQQFAGAPERELIGLRGGEALRCLNALDDPAGCGFGPECGLCTVRRTVVDTLETGQSHHLVEASLPFLVEGKPTEIFFLVSTTRVSVAGKRQVLVSILDITERKKAEQALKEREGLLREVERLTKIGGWEMDLLTRQARWTQGTYDIVEIEPSQPVPGPDEHVSYYLPEYRPVVQEAMRALIEDDQPLDFEAQAHTAKGRLIWVRAVGRAQRRDGQCVRIFGTLQDISERKRAEEELKKSEAHFRYLFENMLNGFAYCQMIFEKDVPQDFIYLQVNQNFAKLTGLKDVVGKRVSEVIPGIRQANPEVFEIYGRVAQTGRPEQFETYLPALDMWFAISVYSPQRGYFVAVFDVVTERKKAEEAIKASEERFRSLAMLLPEIIFETDTQGRLTFTNQAAAQRTGYSQEDFQRGLTALDMLIPEDRARAVENMKKILAGQELPLREYTAQTKDGSTFPCLLRSAPIMRGGVPVGIRGFVVDISERKEAEERLKASEEQFRRIVETAIEGIWSVDGDYRTVFVNPRMAQMLGYSVEEMLGRPVQDFMPAEEWEDNRTKMDQRRRGESGQYERRFRRKDGSLVWCLASVQPISDQKQGFLGAFGMFTDITERKRAEEELKKSEEQVRSVLDASPDMIMRFNRQRICTFFKSSPLFPTRMTPSVVGQDMATFAPAEIVAERMRLAGEVWQTRQPREHTYSVLVNGQRYFRWAVYVWWSEDEVLATIRDVTERTKLEAQLRQSQKMEAIGTLAGGIAHDFNNILGAIIGYAELALDEVGQDGAAVHELKQVLLAGQRAKNLVRQILSFSREREQEQAPVQVATIVKEVLKLLRPATPSNIDIKTDLADQEAYVMADPVQIHQVIMNLCTNAVQAMESAGGVLEVSLQIVDLDQKEAAPYVDLEPGRYQVLSVSDTGVGMDRETLGRIFEPFFTTKEADRGTGLGLSVVHGIALSHGGTVTVYSEPGQGSTFRVYLPVIQGPAPEQAGDQPQTTPGGQERILLVDDEQALVDLGRSFLERLGYRVTATTSSPEALQIFQQDPQAFDLVLTDYTMPHMTGVALAQEMLKVRPELPIIISTGFSHQLTEEKAKAIGIKRMVMKPVLGTRLAHLIREVLNGKS